MRSWLWSIPDRSSPDERRLLGRFYLADFVAEATNVLQPFAFVYLLFSFERAGWALIPLLVEKAVVFALEIPTGALADRFGRKRSVILGDVLSGLAWIAVPIAMFRWDGPWQLVLVCGCFAVEALGQCLVSGAEEAWVVDNVESEDRGDLVDRYMARSRSIASVGGVIAGVIAFTLLILGTISTGLLGCLWVIGGVGQIAAALVLRPVPEHVPPRNAFSESDENELPASFWQRNLAGFRVMARIKPLLALGAIIGISAFASSIVPDAFEMSLVLRELDPRGLAPIGIVVDLLGIGAPLLGIALARQLGRRKALLVLAVVPVLLVLSLFASPGIAGVIGLLLALRVVDDMWDPVEDAYLQSLTPSRVRATAGSIANQIGGIAGFGGLSLFAWMLGAHGDALDAAVPDLVTAFSGVARTAAPVPTAAFGLMLPDAALVLFVSAGLLAAFVLAVSPWHRTARGEGDVEPPRTDEKRTSVSHEDTQRRELMRIKRELDARLDRYNPGEQLSWWIAADAFEIPQHTIGELRRVGAVLPEFFRVANDLFWREAWIRERLEKRFSPHYALLNRAQRDALPLLIRPDVVCDENWLPKFVELEITVGCRADTATMVEQYGLTRDPTLVRAYADMIRRHGWGDRTLALLTAPHPFFLDLPDDARAFGAMLRREGLDVIVLTGDQLPRLRFDGEALRLCGQDGADRAIHVVDRFIDIYEIAELQHPGMGAILDAYVAGKVVDINTAKQFLDEKDWLSLFWEPRLEADWRAGLGDDAFALLRRAIPGTWIIREDTVLETPAERVPIREVCDLAPQHRRYAVKESGTSTTASGAQGFHVLHEMARTDVADLIEGILASGIEHVIQEIVESARVSFTALDPEDDRVVTQHGARTKLSVFYVDGEMTDMRFVASNVRYAVNDEDCVVGVVRW